MISPAALQQSLLALLCFDEKRAPTLALKLKPEIFIGRLSKTIASTALEYVNSYGKPPGKQLEFLLESELRRGEEGKLLGQTLDLLFEQFPILQSDFILSELQEFEEAQTLTIAAQEAIEAISRGELTLAKELIYKSGSGTSQVKKFEENTIWLADSRGMLSFLDSEDLDYFPLGIEALDQAGIRPERKTLTFIIAASGKGKSWFLTNFAKSCLQHHRSVLILTLEMSAKKYAKRFLQSMFSLTKYEAQQVTVPFFKIENGATSIQFRELQRESIFSKRKEIQKKLAEILSYPRMLIKEFPTDSLTLSELELYLDFLKREQGFTPDAIALDYAELMNLDTSNYRLDIGKLYKGLRGLATRRDLAMVTASQGNKESDTAKTVDKGNAAEDWSKVGTADIILTYSQTTDEKKLNFSRILAAKARDSEDRMMALNSQAYTVGQFSLDSIIMARDVAQELDRFTNSPES